METRNYLEEFRPDLADFRDMTMKFHNKEISMPEYKGFSGGYGSYAQRFGEKHMLRLRMAGGRLTKERLAFIAGSIEKYKIDKVHLTTCQSIQLHNLAAEDVCTLIEEVWDAGMLSRGGGGDYPRNVMASPLSGVDKEEYFDVLPYAEAAGEYMMHFIKSVTLPRKLKVAFSASPKNETHATYRDLGFVANADGTFSVYSAGGLGSNPRLGVRVAEQVAPEDILYYIKAMVDTFVAYGNYEQRAKARTRYMQETLGPDGYVKAYREKLGKVLAEENLKLTVDRKSITKSGDGTVIEDRRITPQKQEGLYAVCYQPVGGDIKPEKFRQFYELIKDMEDVEIRVTPEESVYFINCTAGEADKILKAAKDGAGNLFETSVACIGNSICQVGARDSQALLHACVEAVRRENFADGVLPQIHISGCPSSCGTHQTAALGFRGGMKKTPEKPKPGFILYQGGRSEQGEELISEEAGAMLLEEIPEFLTELGRMVQKSGMTYGTWIKEHQADFDALAAKYTG